MDKRQESNRKRITDGMRDINLAASDNVSFFQKRAWFLQKMDPFAPVFNLGAGYRINRALNPERLTLAMNTIVGRYEVLQAYFPERNVQPFMAKITEIDLAPLIVDLTGLQPDARESQLDDLVRRECRQMFDLEHGPLLRCMGVALAPDDCVIFLTIHHILTDGQVLFDLIGEDGLAIYLGDDDGITEKPASVRFQEYVDWELAQCREGRFEKQLSYWNGQFSSHPNAMGEMPSRRPRPDLQLYSGARHTQRITGHDHTAFHAMAQRLGGSAYTLFLAAWFTIMQRTTGQEELVSGCPVTLRRGRKFRNLVGPLIQILPVFQTLQPDQTFASLLEGTAKAVRKVMVNSTIPFEEILRDQNVARDIGRHPVFQTIVSYIKMTGESVETAVGGLQRFQGDNGTSLYDITLEVIDEADATELTVIYSTGIYDHEDASWLVDTLRAVLKACAENPQIPIAALPITPPDDWPPVDASVQPERDCAEPSLETHTEKDLAAIWQRILKVETVTRDDHFFQSGGHSLLVAEMLGDVEHEFKVTLPLHSVFESPTLAELARLIDEHPVAGTSPITPRDRDENFPLSYFQEQIWFLHQLDPAHGVFNIGGIASFPFAIDPVEFNATAMELIQRHEILRTGFPEVDGKVVGCISNIINVDIPFEDIRSMPLAAQQNYIRQTAVAMSAKPFDIDSPPLCRLKLFKVRDSETLAILVVHHLIADNWSIQLIVEQLIAGYKHRLKGIPLLPMPCSQLEYADFAVWQKTMLTPERMAPLLTFWKSALAGCPALMQLPWDKPRPAVQSYRGDQVAGFIPMEHCRKLAEVAGAESSSNFSAFLSIFALVLHRFSGETDLIIGTPITNRGQDGTQAVIGDFVNTLPVRLKVDGTGSFNEMVAQTTACVLEVLKHRDIPFEKIVEHLNPERDASYPPYYQVMFDLHAALESIPLRPSTHYEMLDVNTGYVQCDLLLTLVESRLEDNMVTLQFNTDLFEATTAQCLLDAFIAMVTLLPESPECQLSRTPITSQSLDHPIAHLSGAAHEIPDQMMCELVWTQGAETPDATALIDDGVVTTYKKLLAKADDIAAAVRAYTADDKPVAITLPRSANAIAAMLGIQKSGAPYVIMDPSLPAERRAFIIGDAGVSLVVTSAEYVTLFEGYDVQCLECESIDSCSVEPLDFKSTTCACIVYTSGSTGTPKGVKCTHRGLLNRLRWMWREYPFAEGEQCCHKTSLTFVDSVAEIFSPLCQGIPLHIVSDDISQVPGRLLSYLAENRVSRLVAVPSLLHRLLNAMEPDSGDYDALTLVVASGETLPVKLAKRFLKVLPDCTLLNIYGSTEVSADVTCHPITADRIGHASVSIGKPIDNVDIYILDEADTIQPPSFLGEIVVSGECLAEGYCDDSEDRFIENIIGQSRVFRTGDWGRVRPDGTIELVGRLDHQLKIRGIRLCPEEIEQALDSHCGIAESAVTTVNATSETPILVALYSPLPDQCPPNADQLRQHLHRTLPAYMIPNRFIATDRLPRNTNGKLDRSALTIPEESMSTGGGLSMPANELEVLLANIWQAHLKCPSISIHDNFFELGGHSLVAAEILLMIEKATGHELPFTIFFQAPTIAEQAELLDREKWRPVWTSLVPIQAGGTRLPLFCFHGGFSVMAYWDLSQRLGPDQPVYGLEHPGDDEEVELNRPLEDLVAGYITEIRSLQPFGPYYLAGSSAAGIVAYEAAQQLTAAGEEVALLAMFDTYAPGNPVITSPIIYNISFLWHRLEHHVGSLLMLSKGDRKGYVTDKRRLALRELKVAAYNLLRKIGISAPRTVPPWAVAFWKSMHYYEPKAYDGDAVLFRASKFPAGEIPDPTRGWEFLITNLAVREVTGFHGAIISEPRCKLLVESLDEFVKAGPHKSTTLNASTVRNSTQK